MSDMRQKSLKKNIALNIIRTAMGIIYPLITFPYASRILLSEGIGKVEFANSISSYFLIIANLGIASYASRELARIRDNEEARNKFGREMFFLNVISTLVAAFFLVCAVFFVSKFQPYQKLLFVCCGKILFTPLGVGWLYTAFEDYEYITVRSILFQVISLVLLFVFVRQPDDYVWYAAIGVFSSVGSNVCNFIHAKKYINLCARTVIELKKHLKPVFVFFGMGVAGYLYTTLDTTMIGLLMNDQAVGYYAAANKINRLILTVITAISTVLTPRISYLIGNADDENAWKGLIQKSIDFSVCFSIPSVCGLIVLSPQLINLFCGESFVPAIVPMQMLSPVLFLWALANVIVSTILAPMRKEKNMLYAQILGAVVNLLLNYFLILKYGIIGAIIATLVAEFSVASFLCLSIRKILFTRHFFKNLIQVIIASGVMVGVIFVIHNVVENVILNVVSVSLSGFLVYALMLILQKNDFMGYVCGLFKKR